MDELSWADGLVTVDSRIDRAIVGALRGQDLSGFEIWRWLGSDGGTFALLAEPALYPTLYRLEADRLLQCDWHEGERTRRTYRLTANALGRADENRWPALPFRASPSPRSEAARPARLASPDPEAGSWFVPPKTEPAESEPLVKAVEDRGRSGPGRESPAVGPTPAWSPDGGPARAAIARYASDLGAALDLPRVEADQVRQEIADHLTDSTSLLAQSGLDPATTASTAIGQLGDPRDLAIRISRAQQTKDRRDRAVRRGLFELMGELVLWLAASAVPLALSPGLAAMVATLARAAGLHLVVLTSAQWGTNQMAIMLCIGAFAAGRLSFGHMARISRHSDAAIRRRWAVGGAAAVLAVALLLPGCQDGLAVATLLAAPFAFVAGTYRPKHQNESAYTWRGIATAIVLVAVVTLLPALRLFAYDPNATPGAAPAGGSAPAQLLVYEYPDGTFGYQLPGSSEFATVDLWPASTDGLYVVVDRSATQPTLSGVRMVDLAKLPSGGQWWVAAVVVGPDGQRAVQAVVIQTGASPSLGTALGWLISRL
jgi:DNA-binding PadR family transcriptional regulator